MCTDKGATLNETQIDQFVQDLSVARNKELRYHGRGDELISSSNKSSGMCEFPLHLGQRHLDVHLATQREKKQAEISLAGK